MSTWKEIPGYEGLYEVSCYGEVNSHYASPEKVRQSAGRLLRPRCVNGHPSVSLSRDRRAVQWKVRDLVLLAFVGEAPAGMRARYRDGDAGNCCLENLEWG